MWLLLTLSLPFLTLIVQSAAGQAAFAEGIGYVGPACAVVEGNLYIHGILVRTLNESEISQFEAYQDAIAKAKKLQMSPPAEAKKVEVPAIPSFCYDMSDSTEVVLKGCVVRDNRVFVKGKLVRPLNSLERDTINRLLTARSQGTLYHQPHALFRRMKRNVPIVEAEKESKSDDSIDEVLQRSHDDIAALLEQFLKVNATVAKRFLPVARMSPLLNELGQEASTRLELKNVDEVHVRDRRQTDERFPSAFPYGGPPPSFQVPRMDLNEQPFQEHLPQLTPLPAFSGPNSQETDPFSGHHFPPLPAAEPQLSGNNFFENIPSVINNEHQNSAYLFGSNGQPIEIRGNIKPGDRMMIGGKMYVAVTMNELNPGTWNGNNNNFGNSNAAYQPQPNTNYGSFVGNGNGNPMMSGGANPTPTWQPNNFNPFQPEPLMSAFGNSFNSQPKIRYHPGRMESLPVSADLTPAAITAGMQIINQMPHSICTAHLANPFWFFHK